jgi:hypothetical protein
VFKSTNRGDDWDLISDNLASSDDASRGATAAAALAESPRIRGLLYAGTDRGTFWVCQGDDDDWRNRSTGLPVAYIRSIAASQHVDSRVYVAMSGLNYDDFGCYVFCSEDRGKTWTSIAANLPKEPANVIVEDTIHQDILYLGTFRGVYISTNRGGSWSLLGRNMPVCSIGDLEIQPRELDLIVGTHGRGIYKLNLRPIHDCTTTISSLESDNRLFPIPTAILPTGTDTRPGVNFRGAEKTTITFCLAKPSRVELSIVDDQDNILTNIPLAARAGLNQFRWDLVVETTDSLEPYFINYKTYLQPGRYRVCLQSEDFESLEQTLDVIQRNYSVAH